MATFPTLTKHVLHAHGVAITGTFDEHTGAWSCEWSPNPLPRRKLEKIKPRYIAWRNLIFEAWAARTGMKILVVTI